MFGGLTNKGATLVETWSFRHDIARPANFYVVLLRPTTIAGLDAIAAEDLEEAVRAVFADVNTMADVVQIPEGSGYVDGGYELNPNATDFPTITEDDAEDEGVLTIKDIVWTATGELPFGAGADPTKSARFAAITTDEAAVADRRIIVWFYLDSNRAVSSGQSLTLALPSVTIRRPSSET